jgi:hypothetical protein
MRRQINQFFSLAPMPIMLAGSVYSFLHTARVCGTNSDAMILMWLAMTFAHITPWLAWYQSRKILPVKQQ